MADRVYIDSCVVLSYLMKTPDRILTLDSVFDDAALEKPFLELFTSTISVAEVAYVVDEYRQADLSPESLAAIDALWNDGRVTLVEAHRGVAECGRDIMRERCNNSHGVEHPVPRARGADLIHLGTARAMGLREVWTYDENMMKFANYVTDLNIVEPHSSRPRLFGND